MIKLDAGNVLLKPSQRKQLMSWLRRCLRIGSRLKDFVLEIRMHRVGRHVEVRASAHDDQGDIKCRSRQTDWRNALRDLVRQLSAKLHGQYLAALATA
jgi:hypothetical protein